MADPVLSVRELHKSYRASNGRRVVAVAGVSLDLAAGEILGLVGESGCGKTTLGRAIMQLPPPDSGQVRLEGVELTGLSPHALRQLRPRLQMVFQDPVSSLNPKHSIAASVAAPLQLHRKLGRAQREAEVDAMLDAVGLDPASMRQRLPHELSGGQCQRASIARALVLRPRVLLCDEPVSSLDVSIQAQILNLLRASQRRFELSMLFIAHNIAVVRHVSDRVAVMYRGRICEILPSARLVTDARHPYTRLLLASVPGQAGAGDDPPPAIHSRAPVPPPDFPHRPAGERWQGPTDDDPANYTLREVAPGHWLAAHAITANVAHARAAAPSRNT